MSYTERDDKRKDNEITEPNEFDDPKDIHYINRIKDKWSDISEDELDDKKRSRKSTNDHKNDNKSSKKEHFELSKEENPGDGNAMRHEIVLPSNIPTENFGSFDENFNDEREQEKDVKDSLNKPKIELKAGKGHKLESDDNSRINSQRHMSKGNMKSTAPQKENKKKNDSIMSSSNKVGRNTKINRIPKNTTFKDQLSKTQQLPTIDKSPKAQADNLAVGEEQTHRLSHTKTKVAKKPKNNVTFWAEVNEENKQLIEKLERTSENLTMLIGEKSNQDKLEYIRDSNMEFKHKNINLKTNIFHKEADNNEKMIDILIKELCHYDETLKRLSSKDPLGDIGNHIAEFNLKIKESKASFTLLKASIKKNNEIFEALESEEDKNLQHKKLKAEIDEQLARNTELEGKIAKIEAQMVAMHKEAQSMQTEQVETKKKLERHNLVDYDENLVQKHGNLIKIKKRWESHIISYENNAESKLKSEQAEVDKYDKEIEILHARVAADEKLIAEQQANLDALDIDLNIGVYKINLDTKKPITKVIEPKIESQKPNKAPVSHRKEHAELQLREKAQISSLRFNSVQKTGNNNNMVKGMSEKKVPRAINDRKNHQHKVESFLPTKPLNGERKKHAIVVSPKKIHDRFDKIDTNKKTKQHLQSTKIHLDRSIGKKRSKDNSLEYKPKVSGNHTKPKIQQKEEKVSVPVRSHNDAHEVTSQKTIKNPKENKNIQEKFGEDVKKDSLDDILSPKDKIEKHLNDNSPNTLNSTNRFDIKSNKSIEKKENDVNSKKTLSRDSDLEFLD